MAGGVAFAPGRAVRAAAEPHDAEGRMLADGYHGGCPGRRGGVPVEVGIPHRRRVARPAAWAIATAPFDAAAIAGVTDQTALLVAA